MFSVELKINGTLVAHISGYNITEHPYRTGTHKYSYEYYEVDSSRVIKGTVEHNREDRLTELIRIILNNVRRVNGKE